MLKSIGKTLRFIGLMSGLGLLVLNLQGGKIGGRWPQALPLGRSLPFFPNVYGTPPLAMKGGDPYIRALMRTITASEANVSKPYHVIYGGEYVSDLSTHPNRCILINKKSNTNQCSTAAGRYQFINTTWDEKAQRYHPQVSGLFWWKSYSFEPEYQDAVVYAWLSDSQGWGVDISQLLREGKIQEVLKLLSGTWTSLGYGKETNFMSRYLPQIYQNMLAEELKTSIYSQSK